MGAALNELGPMGLPTVRPSSPTTGQAGRGGTIGGASSSASDQGGGLLAQHVEAQCEHAYYALEAGSVLTELAAAEAPGAAQPDLEAARMELAGASHGGALLALIPARGNEKKGLGRGASGRAGSLAVGIQLIERGESADPVSSSYDVRALGKTGTGTGTGTGF